MSDELQSGGDAAEEVQTDTTPAENQSTGAELATASESEGQHENQAQVDEAKVKQAAIDKVINEKHFQAKQAERERDDALAKVAKFEKDKQEQDAALAGNIPPFPDSLDDDFEEKKTAYNEAIARQARFAESQANFATQQQNQQAATQAAEAAKTQQLVAQYSAKASELGIDAAEMNAAMDAVVGFGLPGEAAQFLLSDTDGPLLTKHLAANPGDVITLSSMPVVQQGAFLSGLKVKAELLRPKTSNTPAPVDTLSVNGAQVDSKKYPNSEGAKFS